MMTVMVAMVRMVMVVMVILVMLVTTMVLLIMVIQLECATMDEPDCKEFCNIKLVLKYEQR